MRKWCSLLLIVVLLCSLCGCLTVDSDWKPVYSDVSEDAFPESLPEEGSTVTTTTTATTKFSATTAGNADTTGTVTGTDASDTEATTTAGDSTAAERDDTTTDTSSTATKTSTTRTTQKTIQTTVASTVPITGGTPPNRGEFRGAWVSYIELDALLKANNTPAKAEAAIKALMAKFKSYNLNTVIWIARANSDAYYDSDYYKAAATAEPLLKAGFDPLECAVTAAHANGLDLHVWVNPYRIGKNESYAAIDEYFYYDGKYYYVPTAEKTQKQILDGIRELVNGYNVDGVHFDDYFYPAGCATENAKADFESGSLPAGQSWGDWRRTAVSALVRAAYAICHSRKGCVFGISPSHSLSKNRDQYFAPCDDWLAESGYVDYLCPQIYFGFENGSAPFDKTVDAWLSYRRSEDVELYFGVGLYKAGLKSDTWAGGGKTEWLDNDDILKREVECLRARSQVDGMAFYSYSFFEPAVKLAGDSTYSMDVAKKEVENLLSVLR